jgi:putative redox protein
MEEYMAREPMVVTHEGGKKFATQIRGHRVVVDQPAGAGGEDAAPMPLELLGAGLGSCVALYVQQFCEARELAHEGMRVEVWQRGAREPNRIGTFEVRVTLPEALPARYAEAIQRVARSCPAHHTLVEGAEVQISVESPALTA